jgi:hypothetical protein
LQPRSEFTQELDVIAGAGRNGDLHIKGVMGV